MFEEAFVGEGKSLYQISTPKMELILERERGLLERCLFERRLY